VSIVGQVQVVTEKKVRAPNPEQDWYPMGTLLPYSQEEAFDLLLARLPVSLGPTINNIKRAGFGFHKFKHARSYSLTLVQPTPGKFRGAGKHVSDRVRGTDGSITLVLTSGPQGFTRTTEFTVRLPRRYSEGGSLDN
jgi:galactose mutarotase-like enzyme